MPAPTPPSDVAGASPATSAWANAVSDAIQAMIADLYPAGALAFAWASITGKPSTFAPSVHTHADGSSGGTIAWAVITGKPSTFAPTDHTHAGAGTGGTVAYSALTGKPTSMTPTAHSHPYGSEVTGKPSTFAPSDHAASHAVGGGDPVTAASIDAWKQAAAGDTLGVRIYVGRGVPSGTPAEGDVWIVG